MKRSVVTIPALVLAGLIVAGCGDFQRRAEDMRNAVERAETMAERAEAASGFTTQRLIELEARLERLEMAIEQIRRNDETEEEPLRSPPESTNGDAG